MYPPSTTPGDSNARSGVLWWLAATLVVCLLAFLVIDASMALLNAPRSAVPSGVKTPNPAKAPWWQLGVQEWLVAIDPYLAGVALPTAIIFLRSMGIVLSVLLVAWLLLKRRLAPGRTLCAKDLLGAILIASVVAALVTGGLLWATAR